jgi:hypothetical protein
MSKKKTLDQKKKRRFDKQLLVYSAAAGATLAVAVPIQANIVYMDIPDVIIPQGFQWGLDLDSDASAEFLVQCIGTATGQYDICRFYSTNNGSGMLIGSTGGYYRYVALLNTNDPISSAQNIQTSGAGPRLASNWGFVSYGLWTGGVIEKFAGLRFNIIPSPGVTNTHYGWVKLSVDVDLTNITVHSYAYETVADQNIPAGNIPEAGSLALLAAGAAGVLAMRKKRAA